MRISKLFVRIFALLTLTLWSAAGFAADFSKGGLPVMGCDVTLSGQIASGDAERLQTFLNDGGLPSAYAPFHTLCLDSPGGSFAEGIKLAEIVSGRGLATAVGPERRCESACALIFMGGRILAGDGYSEAKRKLHPRGLLGFHAPGLAVSNGVYTEDSVNRAYEVAVLSVHEFIRFRERARLNFPESLLLEMLGTPPSRMRRVETVADAAMWKIEVTPIGNPASSANDMVWNACSGLQGYVMGVRPRSVAAPVNIIDSIDTGEGGLRVTSQTGFLGEGGAQCQLSFGSAGYVDEEAIGYIDFPDGGMPGSFTALYKVLLFPPDTRIADLPAPQAGDTDALLATFRSAAGGAEGPCHLGNRAARIVNVKEFVNLRQSSEFSAPVLRRLPLGEPVQILGQPVLSNIGGLQDTCTAACAGRKAGAGRLARQCIDNNAVWYNIMDSRGMRGFVSRKFLN